MANKVLEKTIRIYVQSAIKRTTNITRRSIGKLALQVLKTLRKNNPELIENINSGMLIGHIEKEFMNLIQITEDWEGKTNPKQEREIQIIKGNTKRIITDNKPREKEIQRLQKKLNKGTTVKISYNFKQGQTRDAKQERNQYGKLIKTAIIKGDEQIIDDMVHLRKELLQHRIICEATLQGEGQTAKIKIYQCLLEHGQDIVNYWTGRQADKYTENIKAFETIMKSKGIKKVEMIEQPIKAFTVTNIKTSFSFA